MSKAGALAARPTDKESEKGRVEAARVRRYWAGKAPEWAAQEQQLQELQITDRDVVRTEIAAPVIVKKADARLARLAASRSGDLEDVRERHREIRAAEIVRRRRSGNVEEESEEQGTGTGEEDEEGQQGRGVAAGSDDEGPRLRGLSGRAQVPDEEDEEEQLRRRQAVRERLLQQQRAAEAAQVQQEEEEEEEESSEYETESEDEEQGRKLLKPVFVPKQARETIAEREKQEAEEQALLEYEKKREQERKVETREILKATVEAEEAAAKAAAEEVHKSTVADWRDINTDDDEADEAAEFEAWKARELARIKRARDDKERQESEAAERERLKNMTEEERRAWEAANPKQQQAVKDKKKWKFLQKYWHKGAFFQEAPDDTRGTTDKESIFTRDYSAPTGEDKFNKELLPKVMQVKNFGRSGRTKWTHLLAEDTSQLEAPLAQASADRKRFAGSNAEEFAKPKKFRT